MPVPELCLFGLLSALLKYSLFASSGALLKPLSFDSSGYISIYIIYFLHSLYFISCINWFKWFIAVIYCFLCILGISIEICVLRWCDWILVCVAVWVVTVRFIWYQETLNWVFIYVLFLYKFSNGIFYDLNLWIILNLSLCLHFQ